MAHGQRARFVQKDLDDWAIIRCSVRTRSALAISWFNEKVGFWIKRFPAEDTCGEKDVRLIQLGYAQSQAEMSNASHVAHLFEKFTFRHSEALNRQPRTYDRV